MDNGTHFQCTPMRVLKFHMFPKVQHSIQLHQLSLRARLLALSSEISHSTSEILLSTKPKEGRPTGIGQVYLPPRQLQLLLGEGLHLTARQIQVPDEDAIEMLSTMSRVLMHIFK